MAGRTAPTIDDLRLAADWIREYEDGEDIPGMLRVAAMLDAKADALAENAEVRRLAMRVARETGRRASDPAVRRAARTVVRRMP